MKLRYLVEYGPIGDEELRGVWAERQGHEVAAKFLPEFKEAEREASLPSQGVKLRASRGSLEQGKIECFIQPLSSTVVPFYLPPCSLRFYSVAQLNRCEDSQKEKYKRV